MSDGRQGPETGSAAKRVDPTWDEPVRVARREEMRDQMLAAIDDVGSTDDRQGSEPGRGDQHDR
ncbi:hypothetical protein [Micromonospora sp. DT31]|uniref:hypothetical protein n=1 Tax=Micromonospora sp. DT31 TaxID=3393434 RepID=UPI003CE7D27F